MIRYKIQIVCDKCGYRFDATIGMGDGPQKPVKSDFLPDPDNAPDRAVLAEWLLPRRGDPLDAPCLCSGCSGLRVK